MRISDWSSYVCSSDLAPSPTWSDGVMKILDRAAATMPTGGDWHSEIVHPDDHNELLSKFIDAFETKETVLCTTRDRKSVVSGKSVSVRVNPGGRRIIKKKTKVIR